MKYGYQMQKFSQARQCLMLPHPKGEARSIAHAFDHCNHGLGELRDLEEFDQDISNSIQKLKGLMDISGLNDPNGRGTWEVKAENLPRHRDLNFPELSMIWLTFSTENSGAINKFGFLESKTR